MRTKSHGQHGYRLGDQIDSQADKSDGDEPQSPASTRLTGPGEFPEDDRAGNNL